MSIQIIFLTLQSSLFYCFCVILKRIELLTSWDFLALFSSSFTWTIIFLSLCSPYSDQLILFPPVPPQEGIWGELWWTLRRGFFEFIEVPAFLHPWAPFPHPLLKWAKLPISTAGLRLSGFLVSICWCLQYGVFQMSHCSSACFHGDAGPHRSCSSWWFVFTCILGFVCYLST